MLVKLAAQLSEHRRCRRRAVERVNIAEIGDDVAQQTRARRAVYVAAARGELLYERARTPLARRLARAG